MVYKNNIPIASDFLNTKSQPDLLGNMTQLDVSFGQDHFAFSNLTADNGYHQKLSLANLATPVGLPGLTIKGIGYTNVDNNSINQLFFYNGTNNFQVTPCLPLRAAVNFGVVATVVTVRSSFNCTVTRQSTGLFTLTFTVPPPTVNYLVVFGAMRSDNSTNGDAFGFVQGNATYSSSVTVTNLKFGVQTGNQNVNDPTMCTVMIYGG